jgi:hypothetical protein
MRANTVKTGSIVGLIFSLCLAVSNSSYAEDRPLPADGILGTLKPSAIPKIVIDGKPVTLTGGAQIRNQKNFIVQVGALSGSASSPDVNVLYKKSRQGQIDRIWLLTDQEYERIKTGAKPAPLPPIKNSPTQIH